jgi:hypothetical protein
MARQWADRGGFEGFADHVQAAASTYETAPVQDLWRKIRPTTSATAHLMLKAAENLDADEFNETPINGFGRDSVLSVSALFRRGNQMQI